MLRKESGLTLVELLIAMVLAAIVTAVTYNTYVIQARSYSIQEQVSGMQQNVRVAMDMIARDVRMAGFEEVGYTVPDSNAIVAINSSVGPDSIMVSDSQGFSTTVVADVAAGAGALTVTTLDPDGDATDDFTQNAGVIISNGVRTEGFRITGIAGTTLTLSGSLMNAYLAADAVVVPAAIYDVNGTNLRRNGDVLASNIEDLQLAYIFEDTDVAYAPDDTDGDDTNDTYDIRSVRINLLARTGRVDPDFSGSRPGVEDHAADGTTDQYRRRLLSTVVRVRNVGT